jgi:conjugative relaxase-like TrwC/TraI family protein
MLSIGKLGAGQEKYYLEKVAEGAEDYYSGEGEAEGQWMGDAAAGLGLSGDVEPDQLTAMLTGNDPRSGEPLGLRQVGGRGPVPGFDLTFSAPKSASLLWALGGAEVGAEVAQAHQRSVEAALGYLQREACWTRRGAGGSEFVHGSGYLAAAYQHRSSRNGDPQLHTHVLIANATKGPDGRWSRLYHPAVYHHAKTASYLYEAQLRHELSQHLGVRWQEVRKGIAEVEGFADEHLRAFSTRRAEILEAAGPDASARARQVAALATRTAKEDVSREGLRERWAAKAKEIGLDREALAATLGAEPSPGPSLKVGQLDRQVTAHASHFDRRDAIQAAANLLPQGAPAEGVERVADAFLASDSVVLVSESAKGKRFTTQRIWELEREALARAQRMAQEPRGQAGEVMAASVIRRRPTLKGDQAEMVRRLLAGHEGIVVVVGEAGTGKTFAIAAAAEGWAQAGYELRAAAPTWRAANALRAEGLEATSIASLLGELERGRCRLSPRSVLLVDEAGMVGSQDMAELIGHADQAGAKLVLVGDPEQLGAIEAGGLFSAIIARSEPVALDEVIRHEHELDRDAAKRIREGQGREALGLYRSEERVVVAPDAEARREAMVADWHQAYSKGEDALMVAKRNAEVERLNATARELLRSEGTLGIDEVEVGEARFAAGDQVITRVNDRQAGIYNRERWAVAEVNAAERRVVLDGVDQARRVEVGPDYLELTTLGGEAPALQHAYAITIYCAQGTTADRAYVMADPSMDKQELYVAVSRSSGETYLYATPEIQAEREEFAPKPPEAPEAIAHIAEAAERDRAQTAAHDEALRDELRRLPTEEVAGRHEELLEPLRQERRAERDYGEATQQLEVAQSRYEAAAGRREKAEALGRKDRKRELPKALEREREHLEALEARRSALQRLELPGDEARREREVARQVLAERVGQAVLAAQLKPPPYILKELGLRPSDPLRRERWEKGVRAVEGYRLEHGVTDPSKALGRGPKPGQARDEARRFAELQVQLARRRLGLEQQRAKSRERGMGIERSLGIGR